MKTQSKLKDSSGKVIQFIKDGFINIMKGLGTDKDPRKSTVYGLGYYIDQITANNLYTYNWLAAKVVDAPINDAFRKGRSLLIADPKKKEKIEQAMIDYQVKTKMMTAMKWAGVFGGAVIIAMLDNEDPSEPLDINSIKKDSLKNFIVMDRYNVYPGPVNQSILSDNFGKPDYYMVSREGVHIHHSRLIKFDSTIPTMMEYEKQNYWGQSLFTRLWEPISDSQTTSQYISNLVYEAAVDVYRIKGLNALVAEGSDELVKKRLMLAHEMKSVIHGIALDGDDEYDKKSANFAKLPEIDDRFIQKVSGASGIPVTRLVGISPSGMNATGESDMLNYYDNVQSMQENDIRPHLTWIDEIIRMSLGIEAFKFEFNPLKQLTESEQAEVDSKNATRDQIYLSEGIIEPIDVQSQLAEVGTYVSIDETRVQEEKSLALLEWPENELGIEE